MSHTFRQGVRRIVGPVVLLLALTHSVAAAQKPTGSSARPVPPGLGPGSTPAESPDAAPRADARAVRSHPGKISAGGWPRAETRSVADG